MWPIQLAFRLLISCRIFVCSLTLSNTSSFLTWSVRMILSVLLLAPHFKTYQVGSEYRYRHWLYRHRVRGCMLGASSVRWRVCCVLW
jgi:hypothetical protein